MTRPDPAAHLEHATECPCSHCGLPVPVGLREPDAPAQFCCQGCRSAYTLIRECGLDTYYRLLDQKPADIAAPTSEPADYEDYDAPKFAQRYITENPDATRSIDLTLEGVHCAACVWLIEKLPRVCPGVVEARLSMRDARVRVTWEPQRVPLSKVAATLARLGYRPHPGRDVTKRQLARREERRQLIRIGVAGALAGNVMLLAFALYAGMFSGIEREFSQLFRWVSMALGVLCLAWPGRVFFRGAWSAIRTRSPHLDLPIALALGVGGLAGAINVVLGRGDIYFDSLCVLVFLLLVGRFIQFRQQRRADSQVDLLLSMTPSSCRRVRGEQVERVPIEAIEPGDVLEVLADELLPADGTIVSGQAWVVSSLLTGEAEPVAVSPGDAVFAGTQLKSTSIRMQVTDVAEQSRIGRLMSLVQQGIAEKPATVLLADRIAGWFVLVISLLGLMVFAGWSVVGIGPAVDHTVALLIVACPCALGLATPLTFAVTIGRAAKRSILIKSAAAIDRLARPGRLLLDKTGTITQGQMHVQEWFGDTTIQPLVAAIEQQSTHPVARALVEAFGQAELPADQRAAIRAVSIQHRGLSAATHRGELLIGSQAFIESAHGYVPPHFETLAQNIGESGRTPVFIAEDLRVVALAGVGDVMHDDAAAAIAKLRAWGWQVQMLTGDRQAVAEQVAKAVDIDTVQSEVTPEDKLAAARQHQGPLPVVMVGDGVNDAAALAAADVGIAVSGGAEASLAAADIYLGRPGLTGLVDIIETVRQTRRTVRRNLALSLTYNALAVALAAAGLINPLLAAVLMPASSITVVALAMTGNKPRQTRPTMQTNQG